MTQGATSARSRSPRCSASSATRTVGTWLGVSIATQACIDARGRARATATSVELLELERPDERGVILSTGHPLRFASTMFAGVSSAARQRQEDERGGLPRQLDELLAVGPSRSRSTTSCSRSSSPCSIFFARDLVRPRARAHLRRAHARPVAHDAERRRCTCSSSSWATPRSRSSRRTYNYVQYTLVQLTNFQAGVQTVFSFRATRSQLRSSRSSSRNGNWRTTMCDGGGLALCFDPRRCFSGERGLNRIGPRSRHQVPLNHAHAADEQRGSRYYDVAGPVDGWFTIFIQVNQAARAGALAGALRWP